MLLGAKGGGLFLQDNVKLEGKDDTNKGSDQEGNDNCIEFAADGSIVVGETGWVVNQILEICWAVMIG